MRIIDLPVIPTIIIDFVAWFIFHMAAALITLKMPDKYFASDNWLYKCRKWEKQGRFWHDAFKVKNWKNKLPDGAAILGRGFAKKTLQENDPKFLNQFALESRRAELTHYLAMLPAILFFLWNPVWVGFVMIIYALIANMPCIIAQRYNRPRLLKAANRASKRSINTESSQPINGEIK